MLPDMLPVVVRSGAGTLEGYTSFTPLDDHLIDALMMLYLNGLHGSNTREGCTWRRRQSTRRLPMSHMTLEMFLLV